MFFKKIKRSSKNLRRSSGDSSQICLDLISPTRSQWMLLQFGKLEILHCAYAFINSCFLKIFFLFLWLACVNLFHLFDSICASKCINPFLLDRIAIIFCLHSFMVYFEENCVGFFEFSLISFCLIVWWRSIDVTQACT
jgi:hypothetical protein